MNGESGFSYPTLLTDERDNTHADSPSCRDIPEIRFFAILFASNLVALLACFLVGKIARCNGVLISSCFVILPADWQVSLMVFHLINLLPYFLAAFIARCLVLMMSCSP
jgi:hypothetical protein